MNEIAALMKERDSRRCPLIKSIRYGDEGVDFCEETERPSGRMAICLLVTGDKCTTWDEIREEWDND